MCHLSIFIDINAYFIWEGKKGHYFRHSNIIILSKIATWYQKKGLNRTYPNILVVELERNNMEKEPSPIRNSPLPVATIAWRHQSSEKSQTWNFGPAKFFTFYLFITHWNIVILISNDSCDIQLCTCVQNKLFHSEIRPWETKIWNFWPPNKRRN